MVYQKNKNFDYIQSDNESLAVFDPEAGNVHFFDEVGIDILNILSAPHSLESLIQKLCGIYNVTPEQIENDVKEFINDTIEKRVIISLWK